MSNRKQRIKNRETYNALMGQLEAQGKLNRPPCSNCGKPGAHFVPPSFGDEGFFSCDKRQVAQAETFKKVYGETRAGLNALGVPDSLIDSADSFSAIETSFRIVRSGRTSCKGPPDPPEQPAIDEAIKEALKECFPEKDNDSV